MSQAGVREDRIIAAFERMVPSRVLLLVMGLGCVGLGGVAIWLPLDHSSSPVRASKACSSACVECLARFSHEL